MSVLTHARNRRKAKAQAEAGSRQGGRLRGQGALVERRGAKPGKVFQPIRVAVVGTTVSPGIFETLALLGRDEALRRLDAATSS